MVSLLVVSFELDEVTGSQQRKIHTCLGFRRRWQRSSEGHRFAPSVCCLNQTQARDDVWLTNVFGSQDIPALGVILTGLKITVSVWMQILQAPIVRNHFSIIC